MLEIREGRSIWRLRWDEIDSRFEEIIIQHRGKPNEPAIGFNIIRPLRRAGHRVSRFFTFYDIAIRGTFSEPRNEVVSALNEYRDRVIGVQGSLDL